MAFILTPGQLSRRAEFYHQLAQLTSAGLGVIAALDQISRRPPARSFSGPVRQLVRQLEQGYTVSEAARGVHGWLPELDVALMHAGEESGRLDASFRLLADYYGDRARVARQVLTDLLYPLALLHFAVFILPFPALFLTGDWMRYLAQILGVLLPLYAITAGIVYAGQSRHGERWRAVIEHILRGVPLLGTARHCLALSRLAAALEALLSTGVMITTAWELAGSACGSPRLRRTVAGWRPLIEGGQTPSELVTASRLFPELFASQYTSGEISGKLDETLRRLAEYYREEGTRKMHAVAQWGPRLVYLAVVVMIAWQVLRFWMGYFQQIQNAAGL
jgi:type II secretory pathway component PulF